MSVLVPSLVHNHHPHHSSFFSTINNNNTNRRTHGTTSTLKSNSMSMKSIENDPESDHVPFGVVNSMKQRLLNKVNESYLINHNSNMTRASLSKPASRLSSNENLLQTRNLPSPLKTTIRLSRSQDNLSNTDHDYQQQSSSTLGQSTLIEPFMSYLQPKQDVIIVETTTNPNQENIDDVDRHHQLTAVDDDDGKLRAGQKMAMHRQSYTELHRDEAPKPGMLLLSKNLQ
jgi:hypothetical protein